MTGLAGSSARVLLGVYLGETLGSRGGGGMAANTQSGCIKFFRCDGGVSRMRRLWPMTCFAVHVRMFADALGGSDVGVAGFACLVPGEMNWACGDLRYRGGPVMAILAKCARNDIAANGPEDKKCNDKERRKTEQVSCVFQEVHPVQSSRGQRRSKRSWRPPVIQIT